MNKYGSVVVFKVGSTRLLNYEENVHVSITPCPLSIFVQSKKGDTFLRRYKNRLITDRLGTMEIVFVFEGTSVFVTLYSRRDSIQSSKKRTVVHPLLWGFWYDEVYRLLYTSRRDRL